MLRIGSLQLDFPVVQAALSGYSDMPMRVIARRSGAPYALCEVMLDKFIMELKPRRKNRNFLQVAEEEHPAGGQLMGADPANFRARCVAFGRMRLRCDRHQLRLSRKESIGPLPGRVSFGPALCCARNRETRA